MALSAGGWGRMSEKVASAFKPFLTARALDCRELRAVLSMKLKTQGVLSVRANLGP